MYKRQGYCYGKFANETELRHLLIKYAPVRETKRLQERIAELIQRNNEQDFFISKEMADQEEERLRAELLAPPKIVVQTPQPVKPPSGVTGQVEDCESADGSRKGAGDDGGTTGGPFRFVPEND